MNYCNQCIIDLEKDLEKNIKKEINKFEENKDAISINQKDLENIQSEIKKSHNKEDYISPKENKNKMAYAKGLVKKLKKIKNPSRELVSIANSYEAVLRLRKVLINEKPSDKVEKFEHHLNERWIQDKLRSNPESYMKSFLKKVGYILLKIATLGIVHKMTRGMFLFSPQQQFEIKTSQTLTAAKKTPPPHLK